jgi:hypothetical protein
MAQKKGVCMRRSYNKKTCSMHGCNKNAVRNGVCNSHGAKRSCMIKECNQAIFQERKCCSLCNSVFDWDPTITRIIEMLSFNVLEYLGMAKNKGEVCAIERWDNVFAIAGVCKSWRAASLDYLNWIKPKIGLMPTGGFCERKLNIGGFLSYLDQDDRFRLATTIYVPCGKADRVQRCKGKMTCNDHTYTQDLDYDDGSVEYVVEGWSSHPCCKVYKHD